MERRRDGSRRVLGAGAWAEFAHLPGFKRDERCQLVAIADPDRGARSSVRSSNSAFRTSTPRTKS